MSTQNLLNVSSSKQSFFDFSKLVLLKFQFSPGGVLRYLSDGDVRSPFLVLKFAI